MSTHFLVGGRYVNGNRDQRGDLRYRHLRVCREHGGLYDPTRHPGTGQQQLCHGRGAWASGETARAVRETLDTLPRLSDAIAVSYFAHSAISRTGLGESK